MGELSFREAWTTDAAALGALHVASWRETYAGLVPDALLDGLSADARTRMWRAILDDPAAHEGASLFVASHLGELLGFAACGGQRDEALRTRGFVGEFGALYVLRANQRRGLGSRLMSLTARRLLDQGRKAAMLWVLRENTPARAFYERKGGVLIGEKDSFLSGTTLAEVAYGWDDLSHLTL